MFGRKESDTKGTETGLRGRSNLNQQVHTPAEHCAESQVTCQAGQYIQISSFLKGLRFRGISTEGLAQKCVFFGAQKHHLLKEKLLLILLGASQGLRSFRAVDQAGFAEHQVLLLCSAPP